MHSNLNRIISKTLQPIPDKLYLKCIFYLRMKKRLNLKNPMSFNEKIQWLKLYDRKEIYHTIVDKCEVKKYVSQKIGEEYIIPTIGIWKSTNSIDINTLPASFVIKATHDSGGVYICKDKSNFNFDDCYRNLERTLKHDFYLNSREWAYKGVESRIIAEKFLDDNDLKDYKFFCFNGKCKIFKIDFDRDTKHGANYYGIDGNILPFGEKVCPPNFNKKIDLPNNLSEMICLAEKLAEGIPFVRVDFYNQNGNIYFGEMTLYPSSGIGPFTEEEWDLKLGEWINLPR